MKNLLQFWKKDKYEKMKDNLRNENEKYVSSGTICKQHIKLWDWVVRIKSKTSVKNYSVFYE